MTRDEKLHFMKLNGLAYQEVELVPLAWVTSRMKD